MVMKYFGPQAEKERPSNAKVLIELPKDTVFYETMWAKIAGMPFCCSGGTIGHIGGKQIFEVTRKFWTSDVPTAVPFEPATSMMDLCLKVVPSSRLYAGRTEWMYWAILQNLFQKQNNGAIIKDMKSLETDVSWLDSEKNQTQPFWAGPSYRVKMWFLSDKPTPEKAKAKLLGVQNFVDFIKQQKLGTITESDDIPGSYSGFVHGYVLFPKFETIKLSLPTQLAIANKELQERWDTVRPHTSLKDKITDKVARGW